MKTLEQQSEDYAHEIMKHYPSCDNWKIPVKELIAEAYEQAWVDRGRKEFNDQIKNRI